MEQDRRAAGPGDDRCGRDVAHGVTCSLLRGHGGDCDPDPVPVVPLSSRHAVVPATEENLGRVFAAGQIAAWERGVADCAAALHRDIPAGLRCPFDPRPCEHETTRRDRATGKYTCLDCGQEGVGLLPPSPEEP